MKETFYRFDTPCRICLLADIHDRPFSEITASIDKRSPDIIAVAGDFIYAHAPHDDTPVMSKAKNALDMLYACAMRAPTFVSLGNHEWMLSETDKSMIRKTGVTLLDNEWTEHSGMFIAGLTSSGVSAYAAFRKCKSEVYPEWNHFNSPQRSEPLVDWLDGFEKQPGFKLLMSHHPEYYPKYLKNRAVSLVLSGHAHGGQIRLFGRGLYAPGQGILPRYTSGRYGKMIVSRGLSNTAEPIPRLFNRREIVYILPKQKADK